MGCDIHLFVEKKINASYWVALKGINEPMIQYLQTSLLKCKERGEDTSCLEDWIKEEKEKTYNFVDIQRSYRLYAALADVRNYNRVKPISEPRGLPSDVSAVVKEQSDEWGAYAHHRSYLTVKELSEFDWNQKIRFEGFVDEKQYYEFKKNGSPKWWYREEDDLDSKTLYSRIQWTKNLSDCVGTFFTWSIPKLIELADGDLESVRIVFWFDN
ncbi:hypothetical protein [Paenibacillus larvae]|uniref:Uncharacterized protein n=1 Tax=Paenibacillus larvae subsp. larvae TaxID=147375 RepID=A0A6C0QX85_9BACL|nr:hypothetical protein [Paenibacillus larvae]QHZ53394.1 hypothetical protein ERICV_04343 [Paenibacillus larvae subsp. larvae]